MTTLTSNAPSECSGLSVNAASLFADGEWQSCYRLRMSLEIGQPAPSFSLRNKKREEENRETYAGKHLVLAFYPLAFTGG